MDPVLPSILAFPRWFLLATIFLLGLLSAKAAIETAAAPTDGIFDDTRAFSDQTRLQLAEEIKLLSQDLKCDVWLTATSFPASGTNLRRQAQATRLQWSAQQPAVLLAYDRSTNAVAFSFSPDLWDRYPAATLVQLMRDAARNIAETKLTLEERLTIIVHDSVKRMRELETTRIQQSRWFQQDEKRFALILTTLLIGAVGVAGIVGMASRRRDSIDSQLFLFPDIDVGTRFGAPFGGGVTVETKVSAP